MDTIKKNWGFIVISLVCFVLVALMLIKCKGTSEKLNTSKSEYEKKLNYLDGVGKKQLKLTDENAKIAQINSDKTTKSIDKVHKDLMDNYVIKYEAPKDPTSALRELREAIQHLQTTLEEKEIGVDGKLQYFSFDSIAKSSSLPPKADLPPIFRQLAIVKEIVKVAIDSKVLAINDISRPLGLKVQEEADYTITPVEVTVTATPENGQRFVNAMSNQENFLFVLRTIEIKAPDVTSDLVKSLFVKDDMLDADLAVEDRGQGTRTGMKRTAFKPKYGAKQADAKNDGLVDVPLKRQEMIVFEKKYSSWKLRFDLLEPKYELPGEKKAEEE